MHSNKIRSLSSSSEEDNVPLKIIINGSKSDDPNAYDSLCVPNRQQCEFCDKQSKNRYASVVHNVRHIIIPLMKLTVHQCNICLHHFTSQIDLCRHKVQKHTLPELLSQTNSANNNFSSPAEGPILSELLSKTNLVNNKINSPADGPIQSDRITIVKQEKQNSFETNLIPKTDHEEQISSSKTDKIPKFSLKNRLLFEEDIVPTNCDRLLADLTTECNVKVDWFPPIWDIAVPKSVHYDDLIRPGFFRCKKCTKTFPSRYEAIMHEGQHIFFKNSQINLCRLCDHYILGDINELRKHKKTKHLNNLKIHEKTQQMENQKIQEKTAQPEYLRIPEKTKPENLKVQEETPQPEYLKKVEKVSHPEYSKTKDKDLKRYFGTHSVINGINDKRFIAKSTSTQYCDFCLSFCKSNSIRKYKCVGILSGIGKRHRCHRCENIFFELNLVKVVTKYKLTDILASKQKKKALTKEDRLKNIAQRIKKMNKLYLCVLFNSIFCNICDKKIHVCTSKEEVSIKLFHTNNENHVSSHVSPPLNCVYLIPTNNKTKFWLDVSARRCYLLSFFHSIFQ